MLLDFVTRSTSDHSIFTGRFMVLGNLRKETDIRMSTLGLVPFSVTVLIQLLLGLSGLLGLP
jgi:hypothetical protein